VADVITTQDLSVEDTSKLKTGDMKRSYNMPGKACDKIKDPKERADCKAYKGKYAVKTKFLKWAWNSLVKTKKKK